MMIFRRKKNQVVSPNNVSSVEMNVEIHDDANVVVKPSCCSNNSSRKTAKNEEEQVTASNYNKTKTTEKQVSFSKITIREYPIILGDHPSSTSSGGGPPITIGWDYTNSIDIDVDLYEDYWGDDDDDDDDPASSTDQQRGGSTRRKQRRRNQSEMKIPKEVRIQILQNSGYTMRQINEATKISSIVQNRRIQSNANVRLDYMIESYETVKQGFENVITLGKKRRKEKRQSFVAYYSSSR